MKNPAAQSLGSLAKGVPKKYSKAEIDRRKRRLAEGRKKRWTKKDQMTKTCTCRKAIDSFMSTEIGTHTCPSCGKAAVMVGSAVYYYPGLETIPAVVTAIGGKRVQIHANFIEGDRVVWVDARHLQLQERKGAKPQNGGKA